MTSLIRDESQESRILRLLESRHSSWTPAPELARISLQYCRAVACLRKRGYSIENRVETHGKVRHGFYRLVEPEQPRTFEAKVSECLFGDLSPDRSYAE